jgi:hypothetical protein
MTIVYGEHDVTCPNWVKGPVTQELTVRVRRGDEIQLR